MYQLTQGLITVGRTLECSRRLSGGHHDHAAWRRGPTPGTLLLAAQYNTTDMENLNITCSPSGHRRLKYFSHSGSVGGSGLSINRSHKSLGALHNVII